jgi:ribonucleoside-diphosphate reductase subunit M1
MKNQIDGALTREVFIDQSESFSWFIDKPTFAILSQFHAYGWRRGRKTSSYYSRRLPPADAQKIQIVQDNQDCGNKGFCGA